MKKAIALSVLVAGGLAYGVEISDSDLAAIKAEIASLKAEVQALKAQKSAPAAKSASKKEIAALRAEVNELKQAKEENDEKLESMDEKITTVKKHDAYDNIKWSVDLRTAMDSIEYKMMDGSKQSNHDLFSTRLLLNMAFNPDDHNVFYGQLSYNKAFGADFNMPPRGSGIDGFDWVTNEALAGDELKVKQAYWLYLGDSFLGSDIPWTFSVGRRPATEGFLANLREDVKEQSPLGHIINMEFDGGSLQWDLGDTVGIDGMKFKVCAGRGSTNAKPLFSTNTPYAADDATIDDIDLLGFIFQPYDDGQYKVMMTGFKAWDVPGLKNAMNPSLGFDNVGDMYGAAISILIDGLIEDTFLEDAKLFGSFAWSRTDPASGKMMLGSSDKEDGTSYWIGLQIPVFDGDFGLEFNHGSKYWRSFTYAEDTLAGSKLATRGNAYEAYYTYHMTKALSAQIRYTYMDYDYTGSNSFFGNEGTPVDVDDVKGTPMASQTVDTAQDLRFYIRYRF